MIDLDKLVRIARPAMYPEHVNIASCIPMSRLVVEVCKKFGQEAYAERAELMILNRKAAELTIAKKIRLDEPLPQWAEDEGAWTVGIGFPHADGSPGLHVVAIVGDYLVDASVDQASRPQHDIILPAGFMKMKKNMAYEYNGCVLLYRLTGDRESFKKASPDWYDFKKRYGKVAGQVIRRMKDE